MRVQRLLSGGEEGTSQRLLRVAAPAALRVRQRLSHLPDTAHLHAATQRRRQQTLARASDALDRLAITGEPISVARVAAVASVSRSWLYTQPELLDRIETLTQKRPAPAEADRGSSGQRASNTSLIRRLELAHQRVGQLAEENQRLRDELARAYGRLRA